MGQAKAAKRFAAEKLGDSSGVADRKREKVRRGRPSRQQAAEITESVISAASELFLRDGFHATSMEAVAARANIPKTTLYKRFADKRELARAVLVKGVGQWASLYSLNDAQLSTHLETRLIEQTTLMLLWATKPEVRGYARLARAIAGRPEQELPARDLPTREQLILRIAREIAELGPDQNFAPSSPERVARLLMAMIVGWIEAWGSKGAVSEQTATEEARFMVGVLLHGAHV